MGSHYDKVSKAATNLTSFHTTVQFLNAENKT